MTYLHCIYSRHTATHIESRIQNETDDQQQQTHRVQPDGVKWHNVTPGFRYLGIILS